ncbi:hypothetical protein F5Y09DRAFT_34419 [Xylaria sp. FL1042]|nr:hypothetical protein F5Y09DRAFT_34419 [Xylaria sp. FL1042]
MVGGDDSYLSEDMPESGGINFLVGKRLVALGAGTWSYPCGLLQSGERILTCASRIVREQTGLEVTAQQIVRPTERVIRGEHYVTLFVFCGFPADRKSLTDNNAEWRDWHWSTYTKEDAVAMSRYEKVDEPVFGPLIDLYDTQKTREIDWDREPGLSI